MILLLTANDLESVWVNAPVAQLDRATAFEAEGREFESLRARRQLPY
jgi:hypothetical protein